MYSTGPEEGEPVKTGVALTDIMTGMCLPALWSEANARRTQHVAHVWSRPLCVCIPHAFVCEVSVREA